MSGPSCWFASRQCNICAFCYAAICIFLGRNIADLLIIVAVAATAIAQTIADGRCCGSGPGWRFTAPPHILFRGRNVVHVSFQRQDCGVYLFFFRGRKIVCVCLLLRGRNVVHIFYAARLWCVFVLFVAGILRAFVFSLRGRDVVRIFYAARLWCVFVFFVAGVLCAFVFLLRGRNVVVPMSRQLCRPCAARLVGS